MDIKDFLEYKENESILLNLLNMYDFESKKWRFLPFAVGFLEQEDENPKLWQKMNYFINYILLNDSLNFLKKRG